MARIDIILPCYNPPPLWSRKVADTFLEIEQQNPQHEWGLIVVNDGSVVNFGPADIQLLQQTIRNGKVIDGAVNMGKGFVLREGVRRSESAFCIYTDIDFPYTPDSFQAILLALEQGADVAAGSRDASYYSSIPALRVAVSRLLRGLIRLCLRLKMADTQCGLKGFSRRGREIFLQTTIHRYLFDLEFIYLASRKKDIRLKAVPVVLREGIHFRRLSLKILLREGLNFLRIFFRSLRRS